MKVLVAGWFSFEQMGATAGDFLCRHVVCDWIEKAGMSSDMAVAPPFKGGVDWRKVDPASYSHVVFVCGPFGNGPLVADFLKKFSACRMVGMSLTMLESLDTWNPFDLLWERDSSRTSRPDISFLARTRKVPVVGMVRIDSQPEYGGRNLMNEANSALDRLVSSREMAVVQIDTRLDENATGQRNEHEIESLIARMDVVLTTRMHGMVLAIKNGVPAVVIDSVAGGAKILRQAETIGWPVVFTADILKDEKLARAMDFCLTGEARALALDCRERAIAVAEKTGAQFIESLKNRSDKRKA